RQALERNVLVPVIIERCPLPPDYSHLESHDFTQWRGKSKAPEFQRLQESIRSILSRAALARATEPASLNAPLQAKLDPVVPTKQLKDGETIHRTVFVSYRREDTEDAAGRLRDRLTAAYGDHRVLMDIDSIPLGVDFVDHVAEQITACSAVIVMIGRQWLA